VSVFNHSTAPLLSRTAGTVRRLLAGMLIAALYLFLLAPIIVVFIVSFDTRPYLAFPPSTLSLDSYRQVLHNQAFVHAAGVSLAVGVITALLALAAGVAVCLALRQSQARWRDAFSWLFVSPLLVPNIVIGVALLLILSQLQLLDTYTGLIVAHFGITIPYVVRTVSMSLQSLDPRCEEAARMLGASPWRTFWRVTLPLIQPGLIAGAAMAFLISFDEAVISLFVTGTQVSTLPVEIYRYIEYRTDPQIAALSVLLILISLAMTMLIEKMVGLRRAL